MNDIEILKNLVAEYDAQREENKTSNIVLVIDNKDINAIENLLNKVKELEEKDELIKYCRGKLPKDTIAIMMCNDDFCRDFGNDFISKDKIKEKIEDNEMLKKIESTAKYTHIELLQYAINQLQELLEEEK